MRLIAQMGARSMLRPRGGLGQGLGMRCGSIDRSFRVRLYLSFAFQGEFLTCLASSEKFGYQEKQAGRVLS